MSKGINEGKVLQISSLNELLTKNKLQRKKKKKKKNYKLLTKNKIRPILYLREHIVDSKLVITTELDEYQIKNEVRKLLARYKHGRNIHEH